MLRNCQEWRKTVEGVGIDELYKNIDPWDVGAIISPPRNCLFNTVLSTRSVGTSLKSGRYGKVSLLGVWTSFIRTIGIIKLVL